MNWEIRYLPEAYKDLTRLDGSQRNMVLKAIKKVKTNPLPVTDGGYGKPLGHKNNTDLTGFLKIKLQDLGVRVVYKLIQTDDEMLIVVIGARTDDEVYRIAADRAKKNNL